MKKRVLALMLSTVLAAGLLLTGCGGKEEEAPAEASEETSAEAGDSASGGMTFSDLQDNYAALSKAYDAVQAAYQDDSIKQSDEVESDINQAKELMDRAEFGGLGLPYLVNRALVEGGENHV